MPDFLRDDEEVFYCEITNEIFRDYHEFSERMFLCNSMVWTCSMTGKSNLTYQEAVESEEHAKQCLKEFPSELKIPILYLATLTKRTSFGDMAEDIFIYIKERYFVGENLEASFTTNKWKECHILSVIAPNEEQYKNDIKTNGSVSPTERNFIPSANLYKYEIEHLDSEDTDISEIMIVDSAQLRRKKALFSRDKCKLFLKQYVEQDDRGIFIIKQAILDKFNISSVKWEMIFNGPLPNFQSSKNFEKAVNNKKKHKQETLSKYLEKNGFVMKRDGEAKVGKNNNLLEQMKKREEEFKIQKQLKEEQRLAEKQRKKEESNKLASYFRDWLKHKEDLELEDQKKLPTFTPVKSKCEKYFGNIVVILEFVHTFQKLLSTRDFFPGGFTLDVMERALTEKEVAGPLTDLIQMLLAAIFNCQEEESNNYNTGIENLKDINEEDLSKNVSIKEGTHLATLASRWPIKYQGLPLSRLPLYSLTVSEVLRLHLLSSGARIKESGAKWRYAQRGGYTNEDDPGLHLRLHQAHILRSLAVHNVVQLPISDKIDIIDCLINQLLSYADVRDVVEEKIEKIRVAKIDLRSARATERRREVEYGAEKIKAKKELKGDLNALQAALEKLKFEYDNKEFDNKQKIDKLMKVANDGQTLLGTDRAYRKYLRIESIPGIFINWENETAGLCLEKFTIQYPELTTAGKSELTSHIKKLYAPETSAKETSPTKSPKRTNGIRKSLSSSDVETTKELLLCTTNAVTCPVHNDNFSSSRWFFLYKKEQLEDLIDALNKRGIREGELKDFLVYEKDHLINLLYKTPISLLNPEVEISEEEKEERESRHNRPNGSTKKKDRYEDANLGYPLELKSEEVLENVLIENVLEMEEKVTAGGLGTLKMKDRDKWRNFLQNKQYSEFEALPKSEIDKENRHLKVKKQEKGKNNSRSSTPEVPDKKEEKEYQDPGKYLGSDVKVKSENLDEGVEQIESTKTAIRCLAHALCHVADAVDAKHMKRPLGHADVRANNKHKDEYDVLDRWQQSLLASTSFSQIFLHYGTLDSCVMWSRSALLARCQICRRQNNSENMLLCDSCNLGHHMYCLKPKLTIVPKGDWFCDKCKKEKEKQEKLLSPEPVKKRRRIFIEEEVEEEEEQDSGNVEDGEDQESSEGDLEEEEDEPTTDFKIELCKSCHSGGELVSCEKCQSGFHKECVEPPLRRLPRGPWTCPSCQKKDMKHERVYRERATETESDSEDSDGGGGSRVVRSSRREETREDLPLHNAALQELLSDVMKHEDAWPFIRPVQQKEVPDYYEVISNPMDFGTIKYKLNVGDYSTDSQVLKDVVLVFENCSTYNSSDADVYKCGMRLLKYLAKRAKQIGLKVPPELEEEEDEDLEPKPKKKRTK